MILSPGLNVCTRMCQWEYTEEIYQWFVYKAKEGRHIRILCLGIQSISILLGKENTTLKKSDICF